MIEIKYKESGTVVVSGLSFIIGDNYTLRENFIYELDNYFSGKNSETKIELYENNRTINKKDFIYIKIDNDMILEKEYNGEKTTYCRKIVDKLIDIDIENNTIIAEINEKINEVVKDNVYLKEISELLSDGIASLFSLKSVEVNKKVLIEHLINIGFEKVNTGYSDKFSKISAILKVLQVYFSVFEVKKRILLVLDEIDNNMSLSERNLIYNTIKTCFGCNNVNMLFLTRDLHFIKTFDEEDLININFFDSKIISFGDKDFVIKDMLDIYPSHIEYKMIEEYILKYLIYIYPNIETLEKTIQLSVEYKNISRILKII